MRFGRVDSIATGDLRHWHFDLYQADAGASGSAASVGGASGSADGIVSQLLREADAAADAVPLSKSAT